MLHNGGIRTGAERPEFSIITTCRGRLQHLMQTFPAWVVTASAIGARFEIVVVLYSDTDPSADWLRGRKPLLPKNCMLTVVSVKDRAYFEPSHARNIGAAHALSPLLCFVDADVTPRRDFFDAARDLPVGSFLRCPSGKETSEILGTAAVHYVDYRATRGYDEALLNWGKQDTDFYNRLAARGVRVVSADKDWFGVIKHDNAVRTANYADRRIAAYGKPASNDTNARLCADTHRTVNPEGFGASKCDVQIYWQ